MIAKHMPDHQYALALAGDVRKELPILHIHGKRFLDEYMLAGFECLARVNGVQCGGRRDRYRFNIVVLEQLIIVTRGNFVTR
jgi:hypothetical protein